MTKYLRPMVMNGNGVEKNVEKKWDWEGINYRVGDIIG